MELEASIVAFALIVYFLALVGTLMGVVFGVMLIGSLRLLRVVAGFTLIYAIIYGWVYLAMRLQ